MASNAPKTVQALQLLGDAYMLAILHLLFSSLPSLAFELPFYRTPPSDSSLLKKPAHVSLATHPELRLFFPLPTRTSASDTPSILRIGRLLHLVRRALSSSYYGQQSFGRMKGFERIAALLRGFTVRSLQGRGDEPSVAQSRSRSMVSDALLTSTQPPPSPSPPTAAHSAALFLMQEVILTFILAMKGNDRNQLYPYPRPLPSHFYLSDSPPHVGFHTVGYRRLGRLLHNTGALADDEDVGLPACADLANNWLWWLSLEYLPADNELISTPSLPCTLNREQWQAQVEAELSEEQQQIQSIMEQQQTAHTPPITALSTHLPPQSFHAASLSLVPPPSINLRVNTEEPSSSPTAGWSNWWEESEHSIEFSVVNVNRLVITPGPVYHPLALRLAARFLPFTSAWLQRRLLNLLLILSRSNATNALVLGQADVLAPLLSFLRPALFNVADVRQAQLLDLITQLLPFTPGSASMHALFGLFEWPARFPASLLSFLSDMATRSVPMPYVLLDGKEAAGVKVASIANAKWPPSNGYSVACWLYIENSHHLLTVNAAASKAVDVARKSPGASPAPGHRHHLSVAIAREGGDAASPSPAKPPVRKMSATLTSNPPSVGSKSSLPSSPSLPPSPGVSPSIAPVSSSSASGGSTASSQSFYVLRLDSDDGKSMFDLLCNPLTQQLTLRTQPRSSYVFSGVKLLPGRWHHVVISHSSSLFQGSWCHLYINGQHKVESKVAYVNKAGSNANVTAYIGGALSASAHLASVELSGGEAEVPRHVGGKASGEMLQVPGHERARSNSVSLTVTEREEGSPGAGNGTSSIVSTSSPQRSSSSGRAASGPRWRFASFLLVEDVLPEPAIKSLYDLGPRTSAVVYGGSRPVVVDPLASMYPANRALNPALDNLQTIVAKVCKRAQWNAVTPVEEAAVAALAKRPSTVLLDLDQAQRVRLTASPLEASARTVTSVVGFDRVLFFYHAANGQDLSSPVHTSSVEPRQLEMSIFNSGPLGVCSDARLTPQSAALVQARSFIDRLKQVGGMRRLLALVEKVAHIADNAPDSPGLALRQSLLLIAQAVRRQPMNAREMDVIGGYRMLAHLLKLINKRHSRPLSAQPRRLSITSPFLSRATSPAPVAGATGAGTLHTPGSTDTARDPTTSPGQSSSPAPLPPAPVPAQSPPSSIIDCVCVEILFSLVGLSDSGCSGAICNSSALNELILDFHIWRDCPCEVQLYLLQGLFNSICVINVDKDHNIDMLRESRLVGWLISLASDIALHPDVLSSCVSIIRELLMHQLLDHELHLVADFAATDIMSDARSTDLRPEQGRAIGQGGLAARRSPIPSERPGSIDSSGVMVIAADDTSDQAEGTPATTSRRMMDDTLPAPSAPSPLPVAAAGDSGFKVHFGSAASARVKGLFIEMLLDVLHKIKGQAKALSTFFKRIDFAWIYAVLHSGDPQATSQYRHKRRGSLGRASIQHHARQGGAAAASSEGAQSSAILALKILVILLEESHLFAKFKHSPGFASLPPLLLPHCHQGAVFSILLCVMMGKPLQDVPTAPLDVNSASTSEWSSILSSSLSEGPPVVPELVPVVLAVLRECIELSKFHQSQASHPPPPPAAAVSQPLSPVRAAGAVTLDTLESFTRTRSSSSSVREDEGEESVQVVTDLSDEHLEFTVAQPAVRSPLSAGRHARVLSTIYSASVSTLTMSIPGSPLAGHRSTGGTDAAPTPIGQLSLSPRPSSQRSPSRRATFSPHEAGNVAATVQTTRKKTHARGGSLTVFNTAFSPSHELLAAAGGEEQPSWEEREPKSPLPAPAADSAGPMEVKEEDGVEEGVEGREEVNGSSPTARASPSRRGRHRATLTISTVPADGVPSAASSTSTQSAQDERPAQLGASQGLIITTVTEDGTTDGSEQAHAAGAAASGLAETHSGRPLTPVSSLPRTPRTNSPPSTPDPGARNLRHSGSLANLHQIIQRHPPEAQPAPHSHALPTATAAASYSVQYHSHIVHQPNVKAMNGTITFLTKLFNSSDSFRSIACTAAFTRQLIVAVFASATMGMAAQPHPHLLHGPSHAARKRSSEDGRSTFSQSMAAPLTLVQRSSEPSLLLGSFAEVPHPRHRNFISDDPSVPAAPTFDPFVYSSHQRDSVLDPLSMSRQSSLESQMSLSPTALESRGGSDRSSPRRSRRPGSISGPMGASAQAEVQPLRGTLANIDTADLFRHSTSVFLFQLLREIVVQNLLNRTKGTQMLIDCLDQAPYGSNQQQRIRYQTMLLAGLPSRLQKALSELALLSNSKLAYTIDRLTALLVERLEERVFVNGGPSTFQFLVHVLSLPDCRAVAEELASGDKEKAGAAARLSNAGPRLIRPLYETLNQTVLWLYDAHVNGELSAEDLLQVNQTLLDNAQLLLGSHNGAKTWLACLCHHLHMQAVSADEGVSSMAIKLWSWLMKNKLGTMEDLLRATVVEEVKVEDIRPLASMRSESIPTSSSSSHIPSVRGSPPDAPSSPSGSLSPSPPASDAIPPSPTSQRSTFVRPPISRRRTIDLYDNEGKGGFDHLLQMVDGAGDRHWVVEFRDWLQVNERLVRSVFAVTLTPHWVSYHSQERMNSTAAWNKQQRHVQQDVERHKQEANKRIREAAQMELTVRAKLQAASNVEIQRLLRRDQRSTEIERQASKAWSACQQRLIVMAMMWSVREYRTPSTAERLRKMRVEVAGKRSWAVMMQGQGEQQHLEEEDDVHLAGDDPSIHIDEVQPTDHAPPTSPSSRSFPLSTSALVLRQPWRIEPSEGPARVRRRLCELLPLRPDGPLFSHPYRLWEDERRQSLTGEDVGQKGEEVVGETSQVREEGEEDVEPGAGAVDADVAVDTHEEEEQVEVVVKEGKPFLDDSLPDAVQEELDTIDSGVEGEAVFTTQRASISINAEGDISTDVPIDPEPSPTAEVVATGGLSPQMSHRPGLTIDTRRRERLSQVLTGDDLALPTPTRPDGTPLSASPRSTTSAGSRGSARARGASFTATSSDPIPAVAAEPKRRKPKAGRGSSPHSSTPTTPPAEATEDGQTDEAKVVGDTSTSSSNNNTLPLPDALLPAQSAPVLSATSPAGLSAQVSIHVVAPPASVAVQEAQESPAAVERRRVSSHRPRSLTAEDAAIKALAPPQATLPSSSSVLSLASAAAAEKPPPSPQPQSPMTPAVPVPGSNDDDEGVEGDELLFLEEEKIKLILAGDDIHYHWNCVRVDGMEEVRCILCLCEHSIVVVDNYEIAPEGDIVKLAPISDADGSHVPIASTTSTSSDSEFRRWPYSDVVEVAKRRYLLRPAALELFFGDGTNHLLVVNVEQRESVFQHLVDKSPAVRSSRFLKAGHFLTGDLGLTAMHATISPLTKQWQAGELSNFEYLIAINSVAGRTYNDLSQYPIFPWVVRDYDSPFLRLHDPSTYRDLSKPMGALTEPRAAIFRQRYKESQTLEEDFAEGGHLPGYHYSSHLSTAAIVLYYLLRCEPFTQHVIAFQSGRFDRPDRLFHSIKQSFLSASQLNIMDVKELIPEFFSSPDFLINGNHLKLGVRQDELRVNDVLLPRWAQGSARQFIRLHRSALESDYVSAHLHHWVDLIFGYQQQGKEAVQAQNVFHYLTYAGNVDIDKIADPMQRAATIETIRSFGQTPTQLFTTPHPPKRVVPRLGTLFRSTLLTRFRAVKTEMVAHAIGSLYVGEGDHKAYVTRPGFLIVPTAAAPAASTHLGVLRLQAHRRARLPANKARSMVSFVSWGFPDRSVRMGLVNPNQGTSGFNKVDAVQFTKVYLNLHQLEGVGVVAMPEVDSGLLITAGTEDSGVSVWKAEPLSTGLFGDLAFVGSLYGHSQPVTCLAVSRAYSLIASGSSDSTVILWDLNRKEPVRQLRLVPWGAIITALSFDNCSGALAIVTRSPDTLSVVDVNGALLAQYPDLRRMEAAHPHHHHTASGGSPTHADNGAHSPLPPVTTAAAHHSHTHSMSGAHGHHRPSHHHTASITNSSDLHPPHSTRHPRSHSLSMRDPISCLHVVDAAGYHFLNSLMLIITGHRSGRVKLWYVTFDTLSSPSTSTASSANSTLRFSASSNSSSPLPPPPFPSSDPATQRPTPIPVKPEEAEHKTMDTSTLSSPTDPAVIPVHSSPVPSDGPSAAAEAPSAITDSFPSPQAITDKEKAPAASSSPASELFASPGSMAVKPAPSAAYAGDLHILEEFDAPPTPLMSPTFPTPPQPPARCWHLRPVAEWHRHVSPVTALYVNADCTAVWSGDSHGAVVQWSLPAAEEAKVNTSGLMGIGVPPADAQCLCKAQEKGKGGVTKTVVRRYCVCHPKSCKQVVCDQCVLDHIRARHSPGQHRIAAQAAKHRHQKERQAKQKAEEDARPATQASTAADQPSASITTSSSST